MGTVVPKMPEDVSQPVTQELAQALQNRAKPAGIRAEEIAIGNDIADAALRALPPRTWSLVGSMSRASADILYPKNCLRLHIYHIKAVVGDRRPDIRFLLTK